MTRDNFPHTQAIKDIGGKISTEDLLATLKVFVDTDHGPGAERPVLRLLPEMSPAPGGPILVDLLVIWVWSGTGGDKNYTHIALQGLRICSPSLGLA